MGQFLEAFESDVPAMEATAMRWVLQLRAACLAKAEAAARAVVRTRDADSASNRRGEFAASICAAHLKIVKELLLTAPE